MSNYSLILPALEVQPLKNYFSHNMLMTAFIINDYLWVMKDKLMWMESKRQTTVSQKQLNLIQLRHNFGNELRSNAEKNALVELVI